ncbi:MAG: glycoside hydrolase, partial [Gammaproteobacteria bacterium]|nr:glycoside hydrolase [Gammaproteobacteria bacterium]
MNTAAAQARLPVVLLWHMHQPHYRDALTGEYVLPWTYLHALKDYSDMAAHLEAQPAARAVFNVTPVLIEQLEDYTTMLRRHLDSAAPVADAVLRLLTDAPLPTGAARADALRACLRAQRTRMIERFPPFRELADAAQRAFAAPDAFTDDELRDLAVWYHLAWCGERLHRNSPIVGRLVAQRRGFGAAERRALLELIAETIGGIVPRWR